VTKARVVLVFAMTVLICTQNVPAQAGNFFQEVGEFLFGRPAYMTSLTGGSNNFSLILYADKSMRVQRQLWFDKAGQMHVLKRECGPLMMGMATFTDGSGKTTELKAKLDSSADWFRVVAPPLPNQDMDTWLRNMSGERIVQDGKRTRFTTFDPFVSYKMVDGCVSGPTFVVFDVAKLATGFAHTLYLRTTVRQGKSILPVSETKITFFVESEDTIIGRCIKQLEDNPQAVPGYELDTSGGQTFGDNSGQRLDNSPPAAPPAPRYTPPTASAAPAQQAPQANINLSREALRYVGQAAATVGLSGSDLMTPQPFAVTKPAWQNRDFNVVVVFFVTPNGDLLNDPIRLDSDYVGDDISSPNGGVFLFHDQAQARPGCTFYIVHRGIRYTVQIPDAPYTGIWVPIVVNQ